MESWFLLIHLQLVVITNIISLLSKVRFLNFMLLIIHFIVLLDATVLPCYFAEFLQLSSTFVLFLPLGSENAKYLDTPYYQYMLYVSVGAFLYRSYTPMRKAYYLNKWLHEKDPSFKDIWAAKANLSSAEQKGGERYLEELRRVPRRLKMLPLGFLFFESCRVGYRKLDNFFSKKKESVEE